MNTNSIRFCTMVALCGALSACKVGPDYHRPSVPMPAQYKEVAGWTAAAPADAAPKGDWWTDFHDPLLDQLEPMVAVSNQTVRQNYANYEEALAEVKVARSQLFPTLGITGSATRSGGPGLSNGSGITTTTGTGTSTGTTTGTTSTVVGRSGSVINAGSLEANASWTLDLWGKVRRLIEENKALAQADEATLINATLSEQTLLATTVIELRLTDAGIDLQQKTVDAFRDSLRVTEQQGKAGITATPPSAVFTARVALETAQANLVGFGVARAQFAHAIAVLVGKNPEDLDIPHSNVMPTLPSLPAGMPSTLLQRRPDIAAAERTMAAQNAAVGIAVAAYYPTISLSGAAGFSQSPLDGLLHAANHVWSIGATGTETLFDFGERHAEVEAARAVYEGAVASYRGTVLNALQAVENDLSGLRILADQAQAFDVAVRDSIRGTEIAMAEFQAGTADYTTVAQAQVTQLSNQQSALTVQESRLVDAVSLIGDLGGGWSDSLLHDPNNPKTLPAEPAATAAASP
jgi:NodT family efflux transporter outer membrane factor (OMF) lipoprotein